jgi:phage terminase small subunit
MIKAAAELGFTPSSRSQIQVAPSSTNAFANNGRRGA